MSDETSLDSDTLTLLHLQMSLERSLDRFHESGSSTVYGIARIIVIGDSRREIALSFATSVGYPSVFSLQIRGILIYYSTS